jgi:hypothetical protein
MWARQQARKDEQLASPVDDEDVVMMEPELRTHPH